MKTISTGIMVFCILQLSAAPVALSPAEQNTVVSQVIALETSRPRKYSTVTFVRKTKLKIYNSKTNELIDDIESTVRVKQDIKTKKETSTVLIYKKNGKIVSPDTYKEGGRSDFIDVFSPEGKKEYTLSWAGKKTISNIDCHAIKITPRKNTKRHMRGTLFYSVRGLQPVAIEIVPAVLSFPLEKFYSFIRLGSVSGVPVIRTNYMVLHINVPVVFSNRKMVFYMTSESHRFE